MKMISKNIKFSVSDFYEKFCDEYERLYDNSDNVAGYKEAVEDFDNSMSYDYFKKFVKEFVNFRGDFISSDREAAAFMFALYSM